MGMDGVKYDPNRYYRIQEWPLKDHLNLLAQAVQVSEIIMYLGL